MPVSQILDWFRPLAIAVVAVTSSAFAIEPVRIELKEKALVSRRYVLLKDIADVTGGHDQLRATIAGLDVDDLPSQGRSRSCSRQQVVCRLRLAEIPASSYLIAGEQQTLVVPDRQPLNIERVQAAARDAYWRIMSGSAEQFSLRFLPITAALPEVATDDDVSIKGELHKSGNRSGVRTQIDVTICVNGERRLVLPVFVEALRMTSAAICKKYLAAGDVITAEHVSIDEVPNDPGSGAGLASPDGLIGQRVRLAIAPGQLIRSNDLDQIQESRVAIRAGQTIRLRVRLGSVDVVAMGEAMQPGKTGETIRARNKDSKRIVTGRVTGPATVDVDTGSP